jgi:hypothetical protein
MTTAYRTSVSLGGFRPCLDTITDFRSWRRRPSAIIFLVYKMRRDAFQHIFLWRQRDVSEH